MATVDFIGKGIEIVKNAIAADSTGKEAARALGLYKQALGYLMTGLKYMKPTKSKDVLREKVSTYMQRAEELKVEVDGPPKRTCIPVASATTTTTTTTTDDRKRPPLASTTNVVDEESAKLQTMLGSSIVSERPNVKWEQVAGLETAKDLLKEAVVLPRKFPQLFTGNRKPWQGILLYGPPGTGKSYLAKAVATECSGACFFSVSSADLVCKWQGESEQRVRALFELARKNQPSIIFIDEIDSLCGARSDGENDATRRIKTEFLVQMQGVGNNNKGVLVLGATNTPWDLDQAMRRRFDKKVYIPLPEEAARATMFRLHIGDTPHNLTASDFAELGRLTQGYSGSDISVVVRDALYEPVRTCQLATHFKKVVDENKDDMWEPCSPSDSSATEMSLMHVPEGRLLPSKLTKRHFETSIRTSKPTVSAQDLVRVNEWTREFGQDGGN
jgi:vacuolar protein-sorting-associated protein 4